MSRPLRVLIADDEQMARKRLTRLLAAMEDVEFCGECADGDEVLARVREGGVDVLLLDIRMPNLSGIDAAALLPQPAPHVIFCTAHDDQAIRAFELGAVDYLLKPVEAERLQKALARVQPRDDAPRPTNGVDRLPVSTRQGIVLVDPKLITHAVLEGELVTLHTLNGQLISDFTLRELEQRLTDARFFRVHRGAILNLAHVSRLEPLDTGGYVARTANGGSVAVSRQSARELRRRLGLRKPADEEP